MTAEEIHLSWAPPTTFTLHAPPLPRPDPPNPQPEAKTQADAPASEALTPNPTENVPLRAPTNNDPGWYHSEKTDENVYSTSDILSDSFRSQREVRSTHRHRKRRQEASNDTIDFAIPKVKKASPNIPHKGVTQIAYVLYYEQGLPRVDSAVPVTGIPTSEEVQGANVFPSDLGIEDYSNGAKNLTLLNNAGVLAKNVGFRLKNLSK